jgi:hypothetical protein
MESRLILASLPVEGVVPAWEKGSKSGKITGLPPLFEAVGSV